MTNTRRDIPVSRNGDDRLKHAEIIEASRFTDSPLSGHPKSASTRISCQERQTQPTARKSLRLVLVNNRTEPVPEDLLKQTLRIDPDAQMRNNWNSVIDTLTANSCSAPEIIIAVSNDSDLAMHRMDELWRLRIHYNYSPRPVYLAITAQRPPARARFEIERWGGRLLCLFDVPGHFEEEIEQIRLALAPRMSSSPSWLIVYEGNGETLRAAVNLMDRRRAVRVPGSDSLIAALAVFIKRNGIARSLSGWQKTLADDMLFSPMGGGFPVPSIPSLKNYLRRDFKKCLQRAFDDYRSGFCAHQVIERTDAGTHATKYRIRGEWVALRR